LKAEASKAADSQNVIVSGSGVHYHINGNETSCFGWREFVDKPYLDRCDTIRYDIEMFNVNSNTEPASATAKN